MQQFAKLCVFLVLTGCAAHVKPVSKSELKTFSAQKVASLKRLDSPKLIIEAAEKLALENNADYQISELKKQFKFIQKKSQSLEKFPQFMVDGSYAGRNRYGASNSAPLQSNGKIGNSAADYTVSEDLHKTSATISASWNILDFGLSYYRAKQLGTEELIAQELQRKAASELKEKVLTSYWQAYSYQRHYAQLRKVASQADRIFSLAENMEVAGQTSPLDALNFQRDILNKIKSISQLETSSATASSELASLIGVHSDQRMIFSKPKNQKYKCDLTSSASVLVEKALINRPEIRSAFYSEKISSDDVKKTILETLPNFNVFVAGNFDSNSFLNSGEWMNWNSQLGFNIFKILSFPKRKKLANANIKLTEAEATAAVLAVVGQVHIAAQQAKHAHKLLLSSRRYQSIQTKIVKQTKIANYAGSAPQQALIKERLNHITTSLQLDAAEINYAQACLRLNTAIGLTD